MSHTGKRNDNGLLAKRVGINVSRVVINGVLCASEVWWLGRSATGSILQYILIIISAIHIFRNFLHFLRVF
jgi:hypothetical protein